MAPEPGVDDLLGSDPDEGYAKEQKAHEQHRREQPPGPRGAIEEAIIGKGISHDRPPAHSGGISKPQEGKTGFEHDGPAAGPDQLRREHETDLRQDVTAKDVDAARTEAYGRLYVASAAKREHLGAHDPGCGAARTQKR